MTFAIEGFGVRLVPKPPFVVVRLGAPQLNQLGVHHLGVGSVALAPADGKVAVKVLAGAQAATVDIEPGPAEQEWRWVTGWCSSVLPIEMAVMGEDPAAGLEFRFARVAAGASIALPDGSRLPYGDDVISVGPPVQTRLPTASQLEKELRGPAAAPLKQAGKELLGVGSLDGAASPVRVVRLSADQGASHERTYMVSLRGRGVVSLSLHVGAAGAEVGATFADILAGSMKVN
jgi:hypothetical protein